MIISLDAVDGILADDDPGAIITNGRIRIQNQAIDSGFRAAQIGPASTAEQSALISHAIAGAADGNRIGDTRRVAGNVQCATATHGRQGCSRGWSTQHCGATQLDYALIYQRATGISVGGGNRHRVGIVLGNYPGPGNEVGKGQVVRTCQGQRGFVVNVGGTQIARGAVGAQLQGAPGDDGATGKIVCRGDNQNAGTIFGQGATVDRAVAGKGVVLGGIHQNAAGID